MVVWRYALLPLVCLLLALTHSLVGLTNLVLVGWRVGDGLSVVLVAIAQSTMGKFDFCSHALLPVRSWPVRVQSGDSPSVLSPCEVRCSSEPRP